jgi:hypothetical protein
MSLPPRDVVELIEAELRNAPGRLVQVVDYLLVTSGQHAGRTPAGWAAPVELASGIEIQRLDGGLADRVRHATELRGENWHKPPGDPVVHAYVRQVWAEGEDGPDDLYGWDTDGRLFTCLVLSRLVRDNATSCEHAVRRLINADGSGRLVPFSAFDSHVAYRLHPNEPGWLDVDEARQLRELLRAYDAGAFPERVRIALRRAESVTRERFLEDALPLAVGAVEALLKVGRDNAKAQFAQRTPAAAAQVGTSLSQAQCEEAYDDRSALVHGAHVDLAKPHRRTAFEDGFVAIQETLRAAVRRAIEEPAFGAVFAQDSAIATRWPVTVQRGGKTVTL